MAGTMPSVRACHAKESLGTSVENAIDASVHTPVHTCERNVNQKALSPMTAVP